MTIPTSLEYFHHDGSGSLAEDVTHTDTTLKGALQLFPQAQRGVMFDDIHASMPFEEFLAAAQSLAVPPDTVYPESAFTPLMQELYATLEGKGYPIRREDGREYISETDKTYRQEKSFLLRYETHGGKAFSCPALVAASYLYRLGHFGGQTVQPLWGSPLRTDNDAILSFLPGKYIQVEANAHSLMKLVAPALAGRVKWYFY